MKFLNPDYLLGLLLIAVPIIIHLYYKKRLKKILFSSLMFLKSAEATRLRWYKLKEILILIMRCLIIAGMFFALARPQYTGKLFAKNRLAAVSVIIDNSISMNYNDNFTNALKKAEQVISNYSPKSIFYVTPLCEQKNFKPFWSNKHSALENLKKIKLSYLSCPLKDLINNLKNENTALPKEYIYIGDGQKINFKDMEPTKDLYWLKIPMGSENIAIEDVSVKDPFQVPKDYYELKVNIKNYSKRVYRGNVQLIVDNYIKQNVCEISPGQNLITTFALPVTIKKGVIQLDKDSLDIDNQYFFSKSLMTDIKVLIVGSDAYIRTGLSPSNSISTPFQIENASTIKKTDLRPFQIIILNGIEELTEFEIIKLNNFLSQQANGLIIFLGPKIGANFKNFLAVFGTIEGQIDVEGYLNIKWIDTEYEPFRIFADNPGINLIKFFKSYRIIPRAQVLAKLSNGIPLILYHNNIMLITSQFNEASTDIIYNPNFIPLLHSLIYGLTNKYTDNEFRTGDKFPRQVKIKSPDGEVLSENIFFKPGFYAVEKETVGVNIDHLESNPQILSPEMANELGIKIITPESLQGFSDLTNIFLLIAFCALICELILMLL